MDPKRKKLIVEFSEKLGVDDIDLGLINQALTHKSYTNEIRYSRNVNTVDMEYNQRLEFLGDAVLGMVVARALYRYYPEANEGELTKKKSMAVCEPTLCEIGKLMNIGEYLRMGKGELQTGGNAKTSNIADALEALLGAIYITSGLESVEKFILRVWKSYLTEGKKARFSIDYKSALQEILMKNKKVRPDYKVLSTTGPEHKKLFEVGLFIESKETSRGTAFSRKKAEQKAAFEYLQKNQIDINEGHL
jgi:ribonuclease-3